MIDIPLNKALAAVESDKDMDCANCVLAASYASACFACRSCSRKDGKNVVFKLIDLPKE